MEREREALAVQVVQLTHCNLLQAPSCRAQNARMTMQPVKLTNILRCSPPPRAAPPAWPNEPCPTISCTLSWLKGMCQRASMPGPGEQGVDAGRPPELSCGHAGETDARSPACGTLLWAHGGCRLAGQADTAQALQGCRAEKQNPRKGSQA